MNKSYILINNTGLGVNPYNSAAIINKGDNNGKTL